MIEVKNRVEGQLIPMGVSVTETQQAAYFRFRRGDQMVCVRFPTSGDDTIEVENLDMTGWDEAK